MMDHETEIQCTPLTVNRKPVNWPAIHNSNCKPVTGPHYTPLTVNCKPITGPQRTPAMWNWAAVSANPCMP